MQHRVRPRVPADSRRPGRGFDTRGANRVRGQPCREPGRREGGGFLAVESASGAHGSAARGARGGNGLASSVRSASLTAYVFVVLLVAGVTAGAVAGLSLSAPAAAIYPGVHVAGLHVGGLTPKEAQAALARHMDELMERPIQFYIGSHSWNEEPKALGIVAADLEEAVSRAWSVGRTGSWPKRIRDRFVAVRKGYGIQPELSVDPEAFDAWLEAVKARVERPAKDAGFEVTSDGRIEVVASIQGVRIDNTEGLAERIARVALEPYARVVGLPAAWVQPALDTVAAQKLGIRQEIASYTTRFDPSQVDRTINIRIAAEALDGLILAPGEHFSFNERVGPRVEEAGYKEAPVIIDGELVPDIGGGVCQVSTTLYAAALLSGLRITSRVPHSIPAAYVPLGFDATVVYDTIDFRFQNDTDDYILIKATVEGDRLTVAFYGDQPRFESARLESEVVEVLPRKVIRESRQGLTRGQERVIRQGRDGYRVHVWRVARDADGNEVRDLVSRSFYPARDALVWVGS